MMNRPGAPRRESDFYRDRYYGVLRALFISTCIILLLIGTIIYFILFIDPQDYYATTTEGMIVPMLPMESR